LLVWLFCVVVVIIVFVVIVDCAEAFTRSRNFMGVPTTPIADIATPVYQPLIKCTGYVGVAHLFMANYTSSPTTSILLWLSM